MQKQVKNLLRRGGIDGPLVGIEIEVEGRGLPVQVKGWNCTHDGSLRGENVEYVLSAPADYNTAVNSLKQLNLSFLRSKPTVADTGYAGIHLHVNVGDLEWRQLVRFVSYYYLLEPLLLEWSGEQRKDNLFCLPITAADLPLLHFREMIRRADVGVLASDEIRYAALNFKAMSDYGSLEFRSLRSTLDRGTIVKWMRFFLTLREQAMEDRPLTWVVEELSQQQIGIVQTLLGGELAEELIGIPDALEKMYESVRKFQTLLYTTSEKDVDKQWEKKASEDITEKAFDLGAMIQRTRPVPFLAEDNFNHEQPRAVLNNEPDVDF